MKYKKDSCPLPKKAGAMLSELVQTTNLFRLLHCIDVDLANKHQEAGCPFCGGRLHYSTYKRQPRGGPEDIPEECQVRLSLCCSHPECRRRSLPPSVLFMGRRIYWKIVILVVVTLRSNSPSQTSKSRLRQLFDVDSKTVSRWVSYFRTIFPSSPVWQSIRGRICSSVKDTDLPGGLIGYFLTHSPTAVQGVIRCLQFLSI